MVEPHPALATETARIVRLTEAGRLAALGGRDPVARWRRPWDRRWRVVLFDLPRDSVALRSKLHRLLRARHFGFLQGSVWVSPDPIDDWPDALADAAPDPDGFIVIEGRPATGESDAAIVSGAWDFAEINRRYDRHLDHLRLPPRSVNIRPAPRQPPPLASCCLPSACQTLPHVWQGLVRPRRADRVHGNKRKGSA